jgi:hypothetical protein
VNAAIPGHLARLGSATVYEASGREGLVDVELRQIVPGSRACGPARTVRCGQDDNLMVHAAMAGLEQGEVLVLTMPEPAPVALIGDLLATQAKVRGAAAVLVDAAVAGHGNRHDPSRIPGAAQLTQPKSGAGPAPSRTSPSGPSAASREAIALTASGPRSYPSPSCSTPA